MKKLHLTFIALTLSFVSLMAQNFEDNYIPVVNEGEIPQDILTSSTKKYESQKIKVKGNRKTKRNKRSKNEFYLNNSFVIDELLHSGRVSFSDPISNYVKEIADELLKDEKSLRSELKFYTLRSAVPNAFATDRGVIFVSLGLLAKLNNEAELAFILSHEISHFVKKHNIKTKIAVDEIDRKSNRRFRRNNYDALLEQSNYSKELELEADELGMVRFLKTKWDVNAIESAFDVLEYSHTPFVEEKVTLDFLNLDNLIIPDKYFLSGVNEIVALSDAIEEDDEDDEKMDNDKYSTHPGLEERRQNAKETIKAQNLSGGEGFLVSKGGFELAKKRSQFEICNILIQNRSYVAGLYHNYALSKQYPDNTFLKRNFVFALYGIAQYLNADDSSITPDDENIQGEMQQMFHVLDKLDEQDVNLIASRFVWDYNKSYPEDLGMQKMVKDMVEDMVIYQIDNPKSFFTKKKMDSKKEDYFARKAFADIYEDKDFKEMFQGGIKYKKKFEEDKHNRKKKKSYALGMKNAIFLNPLYYRFKNGDLGHVDSEKYQTNFRKVIKSTSQKIGLKTTILDTRGLSKSSEIEYFNDIILLKTWSNELLNHNMYMINSNYNEVQPLIKKYKSKNIVLSGSIVMKNRKRLNIYKIAIHAFPPLTPLLYNDFAQNYNGLLFNFVLDMESNEIKMQDYNSYNQRDKDDILGMNLYWTMMQIKAKKKTK